MKTTPLLFPVSFIRAAFGISLAALFFAAAQPASAAAKSPGVDAPLPGAIAVGPDTTPGDANSVFRIAQPGSYYLTGNVPGAVGKSGIEIAASHVTLNLNGFALQGVTSSLDGIRIEASTRVENITIQNGTVTGWGWHGITLLGLDEGNEAETAILENLNSSRNYQSGIRAGRHTTIRGCTACFNGNTGIEVTGGSVVEGSVASGNGRYGFWLGTGTARGCSASDNASHGFYGGYGAIIDCGSAYNLGTGFYMSNGGVVQSSVAWSNEGHGFYLSASGRMENCSARDNKSGGVRANGSVSIVGNTILGLRPAGGALRGIHATGGYSLIADNTIMGSNVGLLVDGVNGSNRIEGNNTVDNDIGLKVASTVNFVARNSARNVVKNYQIVANNRVGTIVVPALSAAIDGNSGGGSGTTDPWSNIAY